VEWEGMGWFDLDRDRDWRQAFVNVVMNPQVPKNAGKLLTEELLGSQEGSCSMALVGVTWLDTFGAISAVLKACT